VLARCPRIRFVFAHVGGVLPLVVEHVVRAAAVEPALGASAPRGVREHFRSLHYDTALRMHAIAMRAALQFVPATQLLLGTDAPLRASRDQLAELHAQGLPEDVVAMIEGGNARRLLDRYRAVTR
jgi:predicted TIM-barrel fold metal-dependent hydrolase